MVSWKVIGGRLIDSRMCFSKIGSTGSESGGSNESSEEEEDDDDAASLLVDDDGCASWLVDDVDEVDRSISVSPSLLVVVSGVLPHCTKPTPIAMSIAPPIHVVVMVS